MLVEIRYYDILYTQHIRSPPLFSPLLRALLSNAETLLDSRPGRGMFDGLKFNFSRMVSNHMQVCLWSHNTSWLPPPLPGLQWLEKCLNSE